MIEQAAVALKSATVQGAGPGCVLTGGETILLVEDETFVREVTGEILRAAGYRVLTATNAAAAARTYDLEGGDVDLLLTDVVLPGESGAVLAERLKRTSPELKILMITGYAQQVARTEAVTGTCLAKPFSGEVLLKRIRHTLDRGRMTAGRAI